MINLKNRKKFITIGVLIVIFILYVIFALIFSKPKEEEKTDVPWGETGSGSQTTDKIDSYITINEKESNLQITSTELLNIIKNPKMSLSTLGEYYVYDNYYVFPKRQIKIKKSFDRILSVVFFDDYASEIIKNINPKTNSATIINTLGTPNYNENGLIVYKTKDCYINFDTNRKQVSAYLRSNENLAEFWQLYEIYKVTNNLKRYITDVTKEYPAYTTYNYDVDGLELIYADLGIRIFFKENNIDNGIYLYSNYYANEEVYSADNLKKDSTIKYKNFNLVMKEEIERIEKEELKFNFSWPEKLYSDDKIYKHLNVLQSNAKKVAKTDDEKEYKVLEKLKKYTVYYELNNSNYTFSNVSIISKINNNNFNINTAKVADNLLLIEDYVFFSIANEGIFKLNVNTGTVVELFIGEGVFELKHIKNNDLYYDDLKIRAL